MTSVGPSFSPHFRPQAPRFRRAGFVLGLGLAFFSVLPLRGFAPAQPRPDEAGAETIREALAFLDAGRYLEAAGLLKELAETAARDEIRARAQKLSGDVLSYWLEKGPEGLRAYEAALRGPLGPDDRAAALFNVGMLSYESQKYRDAVEALEAYLREFPQGARAPTARFILRRARQRAATPPVVPPPPPKAEPSPAAPAEAPGPEPQIRVRLLAGERSATISSDAGLRIRLPGGEGEMEAGSAQVEARSGRLVIAGRWAREGAAEAASPGGVLRLNGHPYRGRLQIRAEGEGLLVINELGIEDYLRAVVSKEMIPSWPLDALKAQAVAARTYALYQMDKRREYPFDVDATVLSQVYGGLAAERPATDRAVAETRGQVLRKGGRYVLAYFHANSGGFTEDAGNVWGVSLPYLQAVKDPYSSRTDSAWNYGLSLAELSAHLARGGVRLGRIDQVNLLDRSGSGRIATLRVEGTGGNARLSGNRFRMSVGAGRMRSTLAQVNVRGDRLEMSGRGSGHGVGMSQWGAKAMAERGMSYREILAFYYPGTLLAAR